MMANRSPKDLTEQQIRHLQQFAVIQRLAASPILQKLEQDEAVDGLGDSPDSIGEMSNADIMANLY